MPPEHLYDQVRNFSRSFPQVACKCIAVPIAEALCPEVASVIPLDIGELMSTSYEAVDTIGELVKNFALVRGQVLWARKSPSIGTI